MVKSTSLFWRDGHQEVDLTYTIWGANEPNGRKYENCIETRLRSFPNGTMRYVALYAPLSHKFICKIWFSNTTRAFLSQSINFHCRYVLWNDASCENNDLKFFCEFSDVPVFHLRGLSDCQVQCNIWHSKVSFNFSSFSWKSLTTSSSGKKHQKGYSKEFVLRNGKH